MRIIFNNNLGVLTRCPLPACRRQGIFLEKNQKEIKPTLWQTGSKVLDQKCSKRWKGISRLHHYTYR